MKILRIISFAFMYTLYLSGITKNYLISKPIIYEIVQDNSGDKILGKWQSLEKANLIIEMYKIDDRYYGKIVEISEEKRDVVQPGTILIKAFRYNKEDKIYEDGKILAPKRKRLVEGELKLINNDLLEVTAEAGFITKTVEWKRVKE